MSRPLFDATEEIQGRLAAAPHVLICLDYDGTLTPLVNDPAMAYLSADVRRVLMSLAENGDASVAVISGRERADLQARVGIPGLIYAGNHGLDISGDGFIFVEPTAIACRPALEGLSVLLVERLRPIPGAFVEDKGLTLSVHYRQTPAGQHEEVRRIVNAALASTNHPFQLTNGNMVYEVRPRIYWNKGSAVVWIKEQLGKPNALTIYAGDDATDEDALAALPDAITIRVGATVETAARYHVEGPAEVRQFLEWVDELLEQRTATAPARTETDQEACGCPAG